MCKRETKISFNNLIRIILVLKLTQESLLSFQYKCVAKHHVL